MNERDAAFPDLRLAVIGAGQWGRNLIRVASELPGAKLTLVSDTDPRCLEASAERGVRVTTSADEVFDSRDVDAVLISTPARTHAGMAVAALMAGKHVFVEKPLALSAVDAEQVARMASRVSKVVLVGHIVHYDAAYIALHGFVERGTMGKLRSIYAIRHAETVRGESGAFWALGPHDISFALRCGGAPRGISEVKTVDPDRTALALSFEDGLRAVVDVWGRAPRALRLFMATFELGVAVVDAGAPRSALRVLKGRAAERFSVALGESMGTGDLGPILEANEQLTRAVRPLPLAWAEPLMAEIGAFVRAVTHGEEHPTGSSDGVAVTRVMAALEGAAAGPVNRFGRRLDGAQLTLVSGP